MGNIRKSFESFVSSDLQDIEIECYDDFDGLRLTENQG